MLEAIWDYLHIPPGMAPLLGSMLGAIIGLLGALLIFMLKYFVNARKDREAGNLNAKRDREARDLNAQQDREAQFRSNYLQIELESSRIFTVAVEQPEIPKYLRGELEPDEAGKNIEERTYWFVCQILNVFEIAVSFRHEGKISKELFATWVSWLHELGTSQHFEDYWRDLSSHYKRGLQDMLEAAQKRLHARPPNFKQLSDEDKDEILYNELDGYHQDIAGILKDEEVYKHWCNSVRGKKQYPQQAELE